MTTGTLNNQRPTAAQPRQNTSARSYESARTVTRPVRRTTQTEGPATRRRPRRSGRLGSQQQVSERGRRLTPIRSTDTSLVRWSVALVVVLVLGISSVMYLSGITTDQSFQITDARERSTTLTNEIETLERDVAEAQSASNIAAEASRMGMVAPEHAGVLDVRGDKVEERRGTDAAASRPVIDVNGDERPRGATSDPAQTNSVPGLAPEGPAGAEAQGMAGGTGNVPYADRHSAPAEPAPAPGGGAPAPAPAPVPAPAPRGEAPAPAPVEPPN